MTTQIKRKIAKEDIAIWNGVDNTFTGLSATGRPIDLTPLDWVGIDVYAKYGSKTSTAINTAISALGSANIACLYLSPGTWTISDDITAGSNVYFKFAPGAVLSIASGKTVTFYSPEHLDIGKRQSIISATNFISGTITFTVPGVVYIETFGGIGGSNSYAANNTDVVNNMITDFPEGCTINFNNGEYYFDDTILNENKKLYMRGQGNPKQNTTDDEEGTELIWTSALDDAPGIKYGQSDYAQGYIIDLALNLEDQTSSTSSNVLACGVHIHDSKWFIIDNIQINKPYGHGIYCQSTNHTSVQNTLIRGRAAWATKDGSTANGIWAAGADSFFGPGTRATFFYHGINLAGDNNIVSGCRFDYNLYDGVHFSSDTDRCVVVNNILDQNGAGGVYLTGTENIVKNNQCFNNGRWDSGTGLPGTTRRSGIFIQNGAINYIVTENQAMNITSPASGDELQEYGIYIDTLTGTTTGTTADKLVDSGASFSTQVVVGQRVLNTTDDTFAYVSAIDDDNTLSITSDIFVSGENYSIGTRGVIRNNICRDNDTKQIGIVADDNQEVMGEKMSVRVGTIAAGTTDIVPLFTFSDVPHGAVIHKERVINGSDITQDNTDYETLQLRLYDVDGTYLGSTAEGTTEITGIDIDGFVPTSIEAGTALSSFRYVTKGQSMAFRKAPTNSGQGIDNMVVEVHYLTY